LYTNCVSSEQKLLAIIAHVSYFIGGLGFIIAPLVIYLYKKDDAFVQEHAKQALVSHIFMLVISGITCVLCTIFIGFLLVPVLVIIGLVFVISSVIAAIKAADGKMYYYPLIQSFVEKI
jgi:uncharacterized Tic20 family protein